MSFSIFPYSLPFSSQMTTSDFTLLVASSTVFHRPTGEVREEVCATDFGSCPSVLGDDRSIETHK